MNDTANKTTKTARKGREAVHVRFARVAPGPAADRGVVTLDANDFAQFEQCMTQPRGPNEAIQAAGQLHRELTSRR